MSKKLKPGHQRNTAVGLTTKKPATKIPGTDRGTFSKMPAGPSVGMSAKGPKVGTPSRKEKLRGVMI